MATRTTCVLPGDRYLTRADESALDLAGDIYICAFTKQTSTPGFIAGKAGTSSTVSYYLTQVLGVPVFGVSSNGTTLSAAISSTALSAGTWYFIEGQLELDGSLRVAVTDTASTSLSSWVTGDASPGSVYNSASAFTIGRNQVNGYITGEIHTVALLDELPTDSERLFLYGSGYGREFWELHKELRNKCVGYWQLDESTGTRYDRTTNSLDLSESGGTVSASSRTYMPHGVHTEYGPLEKMADLVASSIAFQDWIGVETEAAARSSGYIMLFAEDGDTVADLSPRVLIFPDQCANDSVTNRNGSGVLHVQIEQAQPGGVENYDYRTLFLNRAGKIMVDVVEESNNSGRLVVRDFQRVDLPHWSAKEETDQFYQVKYAVNYGLEG